MLLSRLWFPVHTTLHCPTMTWSTVSLFTSTYQNYQGLPPSLLSVWTDTSWEPRKQGGKHPDIDIIQYPASMFYEYSELLSNFTNSDSCSCKRDSRNLGGSGSCAKRLHTDKTRKRKVLYFWQSNYGYAHRICFKLWERKDKLQGQGIGRRMGKTLPSWVEIKTV